MEGINMRPIISTMNAIGALPATTAKTLIGAAPLILPAWARSIYAVVPVSVLDLPTVSQSLQTLCELESNDVQIMPFQCLPAPTLSNTGGIYVATSRPEKYQVACPVNGGEQINAYMTALVANTAAPAASITLVLSNMPAGTPQKHGKTGTLTASVAAVGDVAGTRYNFSSAQHIIELQANFATLALATGDGCLGYVKYVSNEFDGPADVRLPLNPIPGSIGAVATAFCDGTSRIQVDIPVTPGQVNIQDYLNMTIFPAGVGNFITGVIYE
jgi:hypothetical protein